MTRGRWLVLECDVIFLNNLIFRTSGLKISSLALFKNNFGSTSKIIWQSYFAAISAISGSLFS